MEDIFSMDSLSWKSIRRWEKPIRIWFFSLTDETYSVLCGTKIPEGMEEKKVYFWISFLDQCYWVAGSVNGALAGIHYGGVGSILFKKY